MHVGFWRKDSKFLENESLLMLVVLLNLIIAGFNDVAFMFQALDTFNTAIVSPIYYVMFTSLTIIASVIMFKVFTFIDGSVIEFLLTPPNVDSSGVI